jgi:ABC-type polysaccharide transport system, permease component
MASLNAGKRFVKQYQLFLLLLPAFAVVLVFRYGPMGGLILAFKDFQPKLGIWGSPFVGLDHFRRFFSYYRFGEIFLNTLILAIYKLAVCFPLPLILAISLNEMKSPGLRKFLQTVSTVPYFISIVIVVGMMNQLFSPHFGIVNIALEAMGLPKTEIMTNAEGFRHIFVWSDVWQTTGYSAVLYIAALSSVSPELYEAAELDGASKYQRIRSIDLPAIMPTAIIMLILEAGKMMNVSFEKVILLQTPMNLSQSEVLTTYMYKTGIVEGNFDYATAGSLFNSVINLVLIVVVNQIARRVGETSLW